MKRKWIALTAGIMAVSTLAAGIVLAACDNGQQTGPGDGQVTYTVSVKSVGGANLGDVLVSLYDSNNRRVGEGRTDASGNFVAYLEPGEYSVDVAGLPAGYVLSEDNAVSLTATTYDATVRALSSVIPSEAPADKIYETGDVMYDFTLQLASGSIVSLTELLGQKKAVVLNFWATWCNPCNLEFPAIHQAYPDYKDNVAFIAIDGDYSEDKGSYTANKAMMDNHYRNLLGETPSFDYAFSPEIKQHFYMSGIPTTVCIDRYGVVVYQHTGYEPSDAVWRRDFAKWSADDYVQDFTSGNESGGTESGFTKPVDVSEQPQSLLRRANGDNFKHDGKEFEYHGEHSTEDAEYSWPWNLGQTAADGYYLYATNSTYDNSFATIYANIITTEEYDTLKFEYKTSCEEDYDILYVIIDDTVMFQYSGVMNDWATCYAYVSLTPGEHRFGLLWLKDEANYAGDDIVMVRGMTLVNHSEIYGAPGFEDGLDLPRVTAWGTQNDGIYDNYTKVVLGSDGYYHAATGEFNPAVDDPNGAPYIFADLMYATNFSSKSISEYAVDGAFVYADRDDTDAITEFLMVSNNSEIPGLIPVSPKLKALLDRFFEHMSSNPHEDQWLQLCKYFDHYGSGKGLSDDDRNPVLGLSYDTAFEAHEVDYDGHSSSDPYLNTVVINRFFVPRGLKYKFVPQVSGVYRISTQPNVVNGEANDTIAWIYIRDLAEPIYGSDGDREDSGVTGGIRITYYFDAGQDYYLAFAYADLYVEGEFTFTVEYIGESAEVWSHASGSAYTYDEFSEDLVIYSPSYVQPVLHEGYYYDAVKDAEGNYHRNSRGEYEADLSRPIYVDFLHTTYMLDGTSLALLLSPDPTNADQMRLASQFRSEIGDEAYTALIPYVSLAKSGEKGPFPSESLDETSPYYGFVHADRELVAALETVGNVYGFEGVANQWLKMAYYFNYIGA